jgi:hypothetical protein
MPGQRRNVGTSSLRACAALIGACLISEVLLTAIEAGRHASADESRGVLTLQFENDYFAGEDRNYTHGMRFAYAMPVSPESLVARIGRLLPLIDPGGRLRSTYSLGQNIFTPDEITRSELIPDDQPYAGWLYVGAGLESERRSQSGTRILDSVELQIGIVGPQSRTLIPKLRWEQGQHWCPVRVGLRRGFTILRNSTGSIARNLQSPIAAPRKPDRGD